MSNVNKSCLIAVWSADSHEEITGNLLIISPATNAFVSQTSALIYTGLCSLICKTLERSFSETVLFVVGLKAKIVFKRIKPQSGNDRLKTL